MFRRVWALINDRQMLFNYCLGDPSFLMRWYLFGLAFLTSPAKYGILCLYCMPQASHTKLIVSLIKWRSYERTTVQIIYLCIRDLILTKSKFVQSKSCCVWWEMTSNQSCFQQPLWDKFLHLEINTTSFLYWLTLLFLYRLRCAPYFWKENRSNKVSAPKPIIIYTL